MGEAEQTCLRLDSLDDCSGLEGIGTVPGCLVPGLEVARAKCTVAQSVRAS